MSRKKVKLLRGCADKIGVIALDGNTVVHHICFRRFVLLVVTGGYLQRTYRTMLGHRTVWEAMSLSEKRAAVMAKLERPVVSPGTSNGDPTPPQGWAKVYPLLSEYLFAGSYTDGSSRQRATLTLFSGEDAGFRAVLNDRENGRSLWATGLDLGELWGCLEGQLAAPDARWRYDGRSGGKQPGKGRKTT